MKLKIYIPLILILAICNSINAQNANTTLSNLINPTAVNANLLPDKDNKRSLGNAGKGWKLLYLDSAIFLGGNPFIKINNSFSRNTIVGVNAMHDNDLSNSNTALGYDALYSNTTGGENVATGALILNHNTTGNDNTATGYEALNQNTTGSFNTANGDYASFYDTSGSYNIAIGNAALFINSNGSENVAIGDSAAYAQNTNVYSNTAIGARALRYNIKGTANTACGSFALYKNKATNNSAFGNASLTDNTTGNNNSAFGNSALYNNTAGSYNTALGESAGNNVTNGSNNTFVGYNADCGSGGHLTNSVAIGNGTSVTADNTVRIGNSSITSIGGFVNWSNISDGRVKKNIKQNVPGLIFINKLQPITYNLDLDAADKILDIPQHKNTDGTIIQLSADEQNARKAKEQIVYTGFVAQNVEKTAAQLNYDFSGVDAAKNEHDLYGLRYSDFVVPLVKAVQELSAQNDSLKNENDVQQNQINKLQQELDEIKTMLSSNQNKLSAAITQNSTIISSASLSQNIPNPFSNTTTINYTLPQAYSSAKIIVTDKMGNTLEQINLSANKGSLNVDAAMLSAGSYQYSLYVDGKLIASKQMIISK
jgi:hypothetical protein